jgi:hypothetical protein
MFSAETLENFSSDSGIPNETQVDGRLELRRMVVKSLDKEVASGQHLVTAKR